MSVLSGPEIVRIIERTRAELARGIAVIRTPPEPEIDIVPFRPDNVGPNSVDVRLSETLLVYRVARPRSLWDRIRWAFGWRPCLDALSKNATERIEIPPDGYVLRPGVLYLGSTIEKTTCANCVPWLDGRSSVGRLGIQIHMTAGRGDDGFGELETQGCSWTLEITCVHPVRIYPGMRIGQLTFLKLIGQRKPYRGRYSHQSGPPVASRFWEPIPTPAE